MLQSEYTLRLYRQFHPALLVICLVISACVTTDGGVNPPGTARHSPADIQAYEQLAREGDADARFHLGTLYDRGDGVPADPERAVALYRAAARQEHTDAQYYLGLMYLEGRGVPRDYSAAIDWFEEAALLGHAAAQYHLGMVYAEGLDVPMNNDHALFWLSKAADQDYPGAQHYLGMCYISCEGIDRDPDKAAEWLYNAGVGFLDNGRIKSAMAALHDMEHQAPGHELVTELRTKLILSAPPASDTGTGTDIIRGGSSVGTGWPIAPGYVVTNNHVVEGSDHVTLINPQGEPVTASIFFCDKQHDIAILAVEDTKWLPPVLPLAQEDARLGSSVFTIGYPRVDLFGMTPKLTAGLITSDKGMKDDPATYQLNLRIYQGNSGGPLVNMHGDVVGIITSLAGTVDSGGQVYSLPDVSYAVKAIHLKNLLSFLPIADPDISQLPRSTNTLEELADRMQHSILIVTAR